MTMMAALSMIVLKCIFDCFNVRIRTSNKHSFSRAWDGGCNGIQHVAIGAELATQSSDWRPKNTGFSVVVLECIFGCFNVRFRTSNQDTFGRARGGGCNGIQHVAIGAELAAQSRVERQEDFLLRQGYDNDGRGLQHCQWSYLSTYLSASTWDSEVLTKTRLDERGTADATVPSTWLLKQNLLSRAALKEQKTQCNGWVMTMMAEDYSTLI